MPPLLFALFLLIAWPVAAGAEITLRQADGTFLTLDEPAARIITLSPNLAELAFAAGAGDRLLATVEFSDFPPPAAELPRVGDAFRLDIERIFSLRPDLVIAWDSGNPRPAVRQLADLGLAVWTVEIREPGGIADSLEAIGRATGMEKSAREAAGGIRSRLAALSDRYTDAKELRYFYQVDERPLYTINGRHLISKGLALCGGHNIFQDEPGLAFQVSREAVVVANPDALMAPSVEGQADPLAHWRTWPAMDAIGNDALFRLPADSISRATPRFLDSLELACNLLHRLREQKSNG